MSAENAFSPIIRILGKGKTGSRSLSFDEAHFAFRQILLGEVEDVQLGAFLMLLRVKEESPEEIAGFVKACREIIADTHQTNTRSVQIDIDWSSYAGKRKQQAWFVLVLALLAQQGYKLAVHGSQGHTQGRLYTEQIFLSLGLPIVHSVSELEQAIAARGLAFFSLASLNPRLQALIDMRPLFGLRSPVHTLCRLINPFSASHSFSSIFHPAYAATHLQAAHILGDSSLTVFKGESGEIERKADATCLVKSCYQQQQFEEKWPRLQQQREPIVAEQSPEHVLNVYRGSVTDNYGEQAVIGTLAICLKQIQRLSSQADALHKAHMLWQRRDRQWFN